MTVKRTLSRDESGAATIEMAIALPILLLFIYGMFTIGVLFQANAGLQHSLGEGARYATLFPQPSDSAVVTRMTDKRFGLAIGTFNTPTVTTPAAGTCTNCRLLRATYTVTPNFLFFNGPAITLDRSKQVYIAY
jgi:Flp pilus assembly protein TadG